METEQTEKITVAKHNCNGIEMAFMDFLASQEKSPSTISQYGNEIRIFLDRNHNDVSLKKNN